MALLRPCATSAGFTATPEQTRRVDVAALRARLEAAGYGIVVDARVLLVVRAPAVRGASGAPGVESSVYANGKVLLKTTDRGAAEAGYADLRPHLEASWS